jgi:NAD(P)-dependent dehydrogenase (short-subunit alcohol dehydrogenase family)
MGADINPETAEDTLQTARAEGLAFDSTHPCDLTVPENAQAMVDRAIARFGALDILINAGAAVYWNALATMDFESEWHRTLRNELDVVFLGCKAAWPHLVARGGGSIINFSSNSAFRATEGGGSVAHSAGKGGVLSLTRQLASEGGRLGIRVNAIAPGHIPTSRSAALAETPEFQEKYFKKVFIKRLGKPEDIAWCAVYLASDESTWVTGAEFSIDGGGRIA